MCGVWTTVVGMAEPPAVFAPWWRLGKRATLGLLAVVAALDAWALASADRDFYLPDVFRPLALACIAAFVLTGLVRANLPRRAARTLVLVAMGAVLVLEVQARLADRAVDRIEQSSDVLLRYRYRPGAVVRGAGDPQGVTVNHLGLLDLERASPKPPGVYRVVVLTGSIANDPGVPFAERFFRRLESQLQAAMPERTVEVVNVSCEGYNTLQQVRALEQVGLTYEPDLVVVAYMLTAASIQNGGYRRIGNSFFAFRFLPMLAMASSGSACSLFAPLHERYTFDLVVRNPLERLALLGRLHHFKVLVAALPVLERFDDPVCAQLYDQVVATAKQVGFPTVRVADAFLGAPWEDFMKPGQRWDLCHPNAAGHRRIGDALADGAVKLLAAPEGGPR